MIARQRILQIVIFIAIFSINFIRRYFVMQYWVGMCQPMLIWSTCHSASLIKRERFKHHIEFDIYIYVTWSNSAAKDLGLLQEVLFLTANLTSPMGSFKWSCHLVDLRETVLIRLNIGLVTGVSSTTPADGDTNSA